MLFLAKLILKNTSNAALVATIMALLGVFLVPAVWVSGAAIALATLARGYITGLIVLLAATAGSLVFSNIMFASPTEVMVFVLLVWLPTWMAAVVLRYSVSLANSVQLLGMLSLASVVVMYLIWPNYGELWRPTLEMLVQQLPVESQWQLDQQVLQQAGELVIRLTPGLIACCILIGSILSLFLARWWQAELYNPGGFGREFHSLNLGKSIAVITVVTAIATFRFQSDMAHSVLLVLSFLYLIQGISIFHAVANKKDLSFAWLLLVYVLMFFTPEFRALIVVAGLSDTLFDFRRRLAIA